MKNLPSSFCNQVAAARRNAGLTQSALAKRVGCMQSAISMLEKGQTHALREETVEKIVAELGMTLPSDPAPRPSAPLFDPAPVRMCPNPDCPSNYPYRVGTQVFFLPKNHATTGHRCPLCGEVLVETCPECGAPLVPGHACCAQCGTPIVSIPEDLPAPTDAWIAQQQHLAETLRKLS